MNTDNTDQKYSSEMKRRQFIPRIAFLASLLALPQSTSAQSPNQPLVYKARLSQSGENSPTANVIVNTLDRAVNWVHWDSGTYIGGFGAPFSEAVKVFCFAPVRDNAGDVTTGTASNFTMEGYYGGVQICAYGEGEDGLIGRREIEGDVFVGFEVYL